MADPLSPDEGVRAALEAFLDQGESRDEIKCHYCGDSHAGNKCRVTGGHDFDATGGTVWEFSGEAVEALRAALSTPVPEEGLPPGSASAAARDVLAERRRQVEAEGWTPEHDDTHDQGEIALAAACYLTGRADLWPWLGSPKFKDRRTDLVRGVALGHAEIERLDRTALSAEPGAGAASALPSPLAKEGKGPMEYAYVDGPQGRVRIPLGRSFLSQVEPVAWPEPIGFLKPEGPSTVGPRFVYARDRTETWMRQVFFLPVFAAEALAAERARADELQGLYDAAIQMYRQATDREGRLTVALAAAEARADRVEEALRNALRGIEVAQLGLNRNGVQHAKLKQVEATLRTILKETPHDER